MGEAADNQGARKLPAHFYAGIALIAAMEIFIILNMAAITTWATPVLWTGLILACDGLLAWRTGRSVIRTGAIFPLAVISVAGWWMFEWFNIFLSNWHYVNLVPSLKLRYAGYVWSFATIVPGVLLTYGALNLLPGGLRRAPIRISRRALVAMFIAGLIFLFIPIVPFSMYYAGRAADEALFVFLRWAANTWYAEFTAAFVWLGFVLLLEPLNYLMGNRSLLGALEKGDYRPLALLSAAGLIDGLLWEFWNYWAFTKWRYTVPILGDVKIFEMPVLGYFGFVAFAWELYNMVSLLYPRALDLIEGERESHTQGA